MAEIRPPTIPLPSKLPKTIPPPLRSAIEAALMRSPNEPVQRLLATLETSLNAAGWTQKVAMHALKGIQENNDSLESSPDTKETGYNVPSGDARQDRILNEIIASSRPITGAGQAAEGSGDIPHGQVSLPTGDLRIPQHVVEQAVSLLKTELQRICEVDDDRYLDWRTSL
ncbi:MAG: hypothetical protein Q9162_000900 [Coniocarpon cinnabarinum]